MNATFLMPCEPGSPRRIDPAWACERDAIIALGHHVALVDHDMLERGDPQALRHTRFCDDLRGCPAWRGWMLSEDGYALLERLVAERGYGLLDDTRAYLDCHHAPRTMDILASWQAPAFLLPVAELDTVEEFLLELPAQPVIIKDWVKSEASLWHEACYIPNPHDLPQALGVVERFLHLRGPDLVGGVLFREWCPLVTDAAGRAAEWRSFIVDGQPVLGFARTPGVVVEPPGSMLAEAASRIRTCWATMDWALCDDGRPLLLEVGYGGVSGIPGDVDMSPMLDAVAAAMLAEPNPVFSGPS